VRIALLKNIYAEAAFARQCIAEVGRTVFCQLGGGLGIVTKDRHGDHLGLKRGKASQSKGRGGVKGSVYLDLGLLAAREIQIADIIGNEQHLLNNGRYIKQAHLRNTPKKVNGKAGKPSVGVMWWETRLDDYY